MRVEITVDKKSIKRLNKNIQGLVKRVNKEAKIGTVEAANKIFEVAQSKTPVFTGALKRSGKVTHSSDDLMHQATISYGDSTLGPRGLPTSTYAVERHEMRTKQNPGSYKWLETTLLSSDWTFLEELQKSLNKALSK